MSIPNPSGLSRRMLTIGVLRSSSHQPVTANGVAGFGWTFMGNLLGLSDKKAAEPLLLQELCKISPDPGSWYAK